MKIISTLLLVVCIGHSYTQNTYDWSMTNSKWSYLVEGKAIGGGMYFPAPMKREITVDQVTSVTGLNGAFNYDRYHINQFEIDNGTISYGPIPDEVYLKLHNDVLYYQLPYPVNNSLGYLEDDTIVNFNAIIGDTWSFHDPFAPDWYFPYEYGKSGITSVLDTGSRVIQGESLKWIYVEYQVTDSSGLALVGNYTDTIFERIGPKKNLIPSEYFYGFDSNVGGGAYFACYSDDNFPEYVENSNICFSYLGVNEFNGEFSLEVFPNPSNGMVHIELDRLETDDLYVSITDVNGKEVDKVLILSSNFSYQLDQVNSGIYFIHLISDGIKWATKKVIIVD